LFIKKDGPSMGRPDQSLSHQTYLRSFFKKMLICAILAIISTQRQKRGFAFAYKSDTYMPELADRPWPARDR